MGYIPTHNTNVESARLDMRYTCNKIINTSRANIKNFSSEKIPPLNEEPTSYKIQSKLKRKIYGIVEPSTDHLINEATERMQSDLDHKLKSNKTPIMNSNLTKDELEGEKWLQNRIAEGRKNCYC